MSLLLTQIVALQLGELRCSGVDLYLHQQAIDTSTPAGTALFGMLGVFAEFERAIIRDRIHASLDRARREGKRLGRPRLSPIRIDQIRQSLVEGRGVRATARRLRVSPAKVTQVRRSMMLPTEQTLESDAQQPAESGA